jgi:hypothetical protein
MFTLIALRKRSFGSWPRWSSSGCSGRFALDTWLPDNKTGFAPVPSDGSRLLIISCPRPFTPFPFLCAFDTLIVPPLPTLLSNFCFRSHDSLLHSDLSLLSFFLRTYFSHISQPSLFSFSTCLLSTFRPGFPSLVRHLHFPSSHPGPTRRTMRPVSLARVFLPPLNGLSFHTSLAVILLTSHLVLVLVARAPAPFQSASALNPCTLLPYDPQRVARRTTPVRSRRRFSSLGSRLLLAQAFLPMPWIPSSRPSRNGSSMSAMRPTYPQPCPTTIWKSTGCGSGSRLATLSPSLHLPRFGMLTQTWSWRM